MSQVISFNKFIEIQTLEEDIMRDMSKDLLPKKVLHFLKRLLHRDKYLAVLKLQHSIMKDTSRTISPEQALVKAAETYGIKPKEMMKVMDRDTRHA